MAILWAGKNKLTSNRRRIKRSHLEALKVNRLTMPQSSDGICCRSGIRERSVSCLAERPFHHDDILVIAHSGELKALPPQGIHHDVHIKGPFINPFGSFDCLQLRTDKIDFAARQDNACIIAAIPSDCSVLESVCDRRGFRNRRMKEETDADQYECGKEQVTFHLEFTLIWMRLSRLASDLMCMSNSIRSGIWSPCLKKALGLNAFLWT